MSLRLPAPGACSLTATWERADPTPVSQRPFTVGLLIVSWPSHGVPDSQLCLQYRWGDNLQLWPHWNINLHMPEVEG